MSTQTQNQKQTMPPQHQNEQPGIESKMNPQPEFERASYKAAGKLTGKVAIITGGTAGLDVPWPSPMPRKGLTLL